MKTFRSNGMMACAVIATALLCAAVFPSSANAQVRTKQPDRGTYQPPFLEAAELGSDELESTEAEPVRKSPKKRASGEREPRLRPVGYQPITLKDPESQAIHQLASLPQPIRQTSQNRLPLVDDDSLTEPVAYDEATVLQGPVIHQSQGEVIYETGYENMGCDGFGCDSLGCDSLGCGSGDCGSGWANSFVSLSPDRWFGSIELLLMYRRGDRPPALVTTGPNEDQADAQVVFGNTSILKDVTAGGRLTLGTFIDPACCRSLVLRGWFAGEEDASFMADQFDNAILGRPFLNVSDGQAPAQDVSIIASTDRADGMVMVDATSNVYGADVSVRQNWFGGCGATVDLLYGYQHMRLEEDLRINASTVSLDDDFAPVGSLIDITDRFDASNEFHGGQFGVASRYREGCWSLNTLAKVGFGSLQRKVVRTGNTTTSSGGLSASDPQGLLVRDTNSGTTKDRTFGWVPEIDLTLGYHRFPRYDVTIGYHIIAMTDALQVSGAIDPNLASNLSDPATGAQNPSPGLRYGTYYVQGIHFGLQYAY